MRGRGDLLLDLRLLLRPQALLGGGVLLAGLAVLLAVYLPWYEVAMEVSYQPLHGPGAATAAASQRTAAATLDGWQAHPWSWLVPALAITVAAVGVLAAVDRPPPRHGDLALVAGLVLGAVAATGAVLTPSIDRFRGGRAGELAELAGRLPDGVSLGLRVTTAEGLWVTLAAAVLLAAIGLATRRA